MPQKKAAPRANGTKGASNSSTCCCLTTRRNTGRASAAAKPKTVSAPAPAVSKRNTNPTSAGKSILKPTPTVKKDRPPAIHSSPNTRPSVRQTPQARPTNKSGTLNSPRVQSPSSQKLTNNPPNIACDTPSGFAQKLTNNPLNTAGDTLSGSSQKLTNHPPNIAGSSSCCCCERPRPIYYYHITRGNCACSQPSRIPRLSKDFTWSDTTKQVRKPPSTKTDFKKPFPPPRSHQHYDVLQGCTNELKPAGHSDNCSSVCLQERPLETFRFSPPSSVTFPNMPENETRVSPNISIKISNVESGKLPSIHEEPLENEISANSSVSVNSEVPILQEALENEEDADLTPAVATEKVSSQELPSDDEIQTEEIVVVSPEISFQEVPPDNEIQTEDIASVSPEIFLQEFSPENETQTKDIVTVSSEISFKEIPLENEIQTKDIATVSPKISHQEVPPEDMGTDSSETSLHEVFPDSDNQADDLTTASNEVSLHEEPPESQVSVHQEAPNNEIPLEMENVVVASLEAVTEGVSVQDSKAVSIQKEPPEPAAETSIAIINSEDSEQISENELQTQELVTVSPIGSVIAEENRQFSVHKEVANNDTPPADSTPLAKMKVSDSNQVSLHEQVPDSEMQTEDISGAPPSTGAASLSAPASNAAPTQEQAPQSETKIEDTATAPLEEAYAHENVQEPPKECVQEPLKEYVQEPPNECFQEPPKECVQESPKECFQEASKECVQEPPQECVQECSDYQCTPAEQTCTVENEQVNTASGSTTVHFHCCCCCGCPLTRTCGNGAPQEHWQNISYAGSACPHIPSWGAYRQEGSNDYYNTFIPGADGCFIYMPCLPGHPAFNAAVANSFVPMQQRNGSRAGGASRNSRTGKQKSSEGLKSQGSKRNSQISRKISNVSKNNSNEGSTANQIPGSSTLPEAGSNGGKGGSGKIEKNQKARDKIDRQKAGSNAVVTSKSQCSRVCQVNISGRCLSAIAAANVMRKDKSKNIVRRQCSRACQTECSLKSLREIAGFYGNQTVRDDASRRRSGVVEKNAQTALGLQMPFSRRILSTKASARNNHRARDDSSCQRRASKSVVNRQTQSSRERQTGSSRIGNLATAGLSAAIKKMRAASRMKHATNFRTPGIFQYKNRVQENSSSNEADESYT